MKLWILFHIIILFSYSMNAIDTLIFLGDSLTAGYNIAKHKAYPNLIQEKIGSSNVTIINAGISGDTTFTLINRLNFTLDNTKPEVAFVAIGANDGLRGYNPTIIKENITTIITILKNRKITPILAGITLPQNYSKQYISDFENIYKEVATENQILFYPNLLLNVAGVDKLNLNDRIHPNEDGHQIMATNIYEFIISNNIIETKNSLK